MMVLYKCGNLERSESVMINAGKSEQIDAERSEIGLRRVASMPDRQQELKNEQKPDSVHEVCDIPVKIAPVVDEFETENTEESAVAETTNDANEGDKDMKKIFW